MSEAPHFSNHTAPVDLAREPRFDLGAIKVRPSLCEVVTDKETLRLQPRVMQVLVALVRAKGDVVSRDALLASCWGGLAIGDDAINRCIARLRRLCEIETPGAFAIETLARVGYRLTLLETPVAASSSSPDGLSAPTPRRRGRFALAASVGLVVLAGATWLTFGRPGWGPKPDGVAITPFDSASGDPLARSVADGVVEVIAGSLTDTDLKPLQADAGRGLSGLQRDAAAARVGASVALSGRVQHDGPVLNASVALDDARRHERLWSGRFSRPASEGQAFQEQIAAKVSPVLQCAQEGFQGGIGTESLRFYLRGCDWLSSNGDDAEGRDLFKKVVMREPRFAPGWADFALVSEWVADSLPTDQANAARVDARSAAERALKLNPKLGAAYVALSHLALFKNDLWQSQGALREGLSRAPDSAGLNNVEADFLSLVGRDRDAVVYAERAASLDKLQPFFATELCSYLAHTGRMNEARQVISRALRLWPDNSEVMTLQMSTEARAGDPDLALRLLNQVKSRLPMPDALIEDWRQFILARQSHDPLKIKAYAQGVLQTFKAGKMTAERALVRLNGIGATNEAFAVADIAAGSPGMDTGSLFRASADGKVMWRDPRFMPLAMRVGLVGFWKRSGLWPDFCESPDRPYDCRVEAEKLLRGSV